MVDTVRPQTDVQTDAQTAARAAQAAAKRKKKQQPEAQQQEENDQSLLGSIKRGYKKIAQGAQNFANTKIRSRR